MADFGVVEASVEGLPAQIEQVGREQVESLESKGRNIADRLGICLSALCVIHCILTPILLLFLPTLQILEFHEVFHTALLVVLPLLAVIAFIPGYRRHRDARVFAWAFPGLALITAAAVFFEHADWLSAGVSVAGSLLLIQAHLLNRRFCACCEIGHGKKPVRLSARASRFHVVKAQSKLLTRPKR